MTDLPVQGVVLISGVPGAGKTTLAREVCRTLPRAAHVEADALHKMIVSGGLWPSDEPRDRAFEQLALRGRNASLLADSFAAAGFVAVVDDIIVGTRVDEYLANLTSTPLYFVLLHPNLKCLRERNRDRDKVDVFDQAQELFETAASTGLGLSIDTSTQTVAQSVDAVLTGLAEARIR